jgi:hypothetical protein
MNKKEKVAVLKLSLRFFALICFAYGIGYMFFPQILVGLSGGAPVPSAWLRWPGGILIALAIGAVSIFNDIEKQDAIFFTFALGTLLCGLALLYSMFFEMAAKTWFTALPAIISLLSSGLLWYARAKGRDILLKGKKENPSS